MDKLIEEKYKLGKGIAIDRITKLTFNIAESTFCNEQTFYLQMRMFLSHRYSDKWLQEEKYEGIEYVSWRRVQSVLSSCLV